MVLLLHRSKFKVIEIPVQMRRRMYGQSSISLAKGLFYVLKVSVCLVAGHDSPAVAKREDRVAVNGREVVFMMPRIILLFFGATVVIVAVRRMRVYRLKERHMLMFILTGLPFFALAIWPAGLGGWRSDCRSIITRCRCFAWRRF